MCFETILFFLSGEILDLIKPPSNYALFYKKKIHSSAEFILQ